MRRLRQRHGQVGEGGVGGAGVRLLGEMDALDHDLGEIGEGAGGFGRDVAAGGGGEEASESGVEDSPAGVNRRHKKSPDGVGAQC